MKIQSPDILTAFGTREKPASAKGKEAIFAGFLADATGTREPGIYARMEQLTTYYLDRIEQRIGEIGFNEAMKELKEVRKIMMILSILYAESPEDVKDEIEEIVKDFEALPPKSPAEMMQRITDHLLEAAEENPEMKDRLKALLLMITRMRSLSIEAVETMAEKHDVVF